MMSTGPDSRNVRKSRERDLHVKKRTVIKEQSARQVHVTEQGAVIYAFVLLYILCCLEWML